jgi:DNA-binding MarR family transcriptional regulator
LKAASEPALDSDRVMRILEEIERDPDVSQATLAEQLDVAVGTVNWLLKRFIEKGYVKVKRLQRRKLRYIITPEGLAFRARLTINYIDTSLRLYRRVREQVAEELSLLQQNGYTQVTIHGDGDIAEICRLSCLEKGISVVAGVQTDERTLGSGAQSGEQAPGASVTPVLEIKGTKVNLKMETLSE